MSLPNMPPTEAVCYLPCAIPSDWPLESLRRFAPRIQTLTTSRLSPWDIDREEEYLREQWEDELVKRGFDAERDYIGQMTKVPPAANAILLGAAIRLRLGCKYINVAHYLPPSHKHGGDPCYTSFRLYLEDPV